MGVKILTSVPIGSPSGVPRYWRNVVEGLAARGLRADCLVMDEWRDRKDLVTAASDLVVTTNECACALPAEYVIIAVQHGSAGVHKERVPNWDCGNMVEEQKRSAARPRTYWVACSDWAAYYSYQHMGVEADRIIMGCVDTELFVPGERQYRRDARRPVVLHSCSDGNKGAGAIDAIGELLEPDFEIRQLRCSQDEVPAAMREGDIWLSLSRSEGLPTVVQEAMVTNLVVVGTDVGVLWPHTDGLALYEGERQLGWFNPEVKCFVFRWQDRDDPALVAALVRRAWAMRAAAQPSDNARRWYNRDIFTQKWIEVLKETMERFGVKGSSDAAVKADRLVGAPQKQKSPREKMHAAQGDPMRRCTHCSGVRLARGQR